MELEVEVWEAEGKASCLASISYTTACGRRESHAGVLPCTYTKLVDLVGLDWLFSSGPSSLEEDLDPQVEWWLGHRFLGVKSKNDPIVGTPIVWPLTKLSRMCTNLLQLIAEVWAWTRLSPCWRSQEASLSWICFLPAQMLRMRWHVRVCVTAAGAENFRKLFQVCFIWKGRPCVLAPQSFGYLQVRKKNTFAFHYCKCEKICLEPHQTIRMTGSSWSWHAGSKRCFKQQCACAACLNILRIAKQVASMKKEFKTEAWPQRNDIVFVFKK